jgi:hypothetical protein
MVAGVLLAIAVIGAGHLFVSGEMGVTEKGYSRGALHAAHSKLGELQRLPATHGDLSVGNHLDPNNPITIDDRGTADLGDDLQGHRRWVVVGVDDPADGAGEGGSDYLEVLVEVAEDSAFSSTLAELQTIIAP